MNPKVSIIILNWNGKDYSKRCLKSIKQNVRYPNYEVIFVDNASTDGSVEMVEKEFPKAKVIKNPKNYGCAKGNNEGVKIAEGDIIFLLNNDTKVLPKTIEKMVSFLVSNPKIGIVGPKLLYPDGRLQPSCRTFPSLRGELFSALFLDRIFLKSPFFNKYHIGNFNYDKIKEVDQPLGSALMIKKEIIDKIGLLDERYFIYYEEVDFCYRAKKAGYKIFFIPYAEMIHYGGKSSEKIPVKTSEYIEESKLNFFLKNYGLLSFLGTIPLNIIHIFVLFLIYPIYLYKHKKPCYKHKIKAILKAYNQILKH